MLALSRPPATSSPPPQRTDAPTPPPPRPRPRARSASPRMLTTEARSFASCPSGRSGCPLKSASVITSPSTASPRNSSRSLVGSPPFSYAYDRWVSARPISSASKVTPSAPSSEDESGLERGSPLTPTDRPAGQTATTCLLSYVPQTLQTVCGSFGRRQARFSQMTSVGADVFHCDRRERVGAPGHRR